MLTQCGYTRLELKTGGQVELSQSSQSTFSGCFLEPKNREGRGAKEVQSPVSLYNNLHWSPERVEGGIHTLCGRTFGKSLD